MHTKETVKNFNKRYVLGGFFPGQRSDMANVHDIVDEGSHPHGIRFLKNSDVFQNT